MKWVWLWLLFLPNAHAGQELCEMFDFIECTDSFAGSRAAPSSRSSSGASMPSSNTTQNINPATISTDKGLGLETLHYDGSYDFNVVTGSGAIGSGFSTSNNEGSFFGPPTNESLEDYEQRISDRKKSSSKKSSLAVALKMLKQKQKKYWWPHLNFGLIGLYNKSTSKPNAGGGFSGSFGPLVGSMARYRDDFKDPESGESSPYYVNSWSLGLKILTFAIEHTEITSMVPSQAQVKLDTATFFYRRLMLTYGHRKEISKFRKYYYGSSLFGDEYEKKENFLGVQVLITGKIIVGAFHNYYLNRELSLGLTAFLF